MLKLHYGSAIFLLFVHYFSAKVVLNTFLTSCISSSFCQFGIIFVYLQVKLRTKTKRYATKRTCRCYENKNIIYIYR